MITKAATSLSPVCIGQDDGQDGVRLPVRLHRIEQRGEAGGGGGDDLDGQVVAARALPGRGDVGQVHAEKIIGRAREDLGRGPVMLNDPAGAVDAENERPHRGGARVRALVHVHRRRHLAAHLLAGCHGRLLKILCMTRSRSLWANRPCI
jgi:hypothetical protein